MALCGEGAGGRCARATSGAANAAIIAMLNARRPGRCLAPGGFVMPLLRSRQPLRRGLDGGARNRGREKKRGRMSARRVGLHFARGRTRERSLPRSEGVVDTEAQLTHVLSGVHV